jgi:SPP1 gp7 family putative phage head morphogenesis protein
MKKINPQYKTQIEQIKIDGEDYADEEMKPVYKDQSLTLDGVNALLGTLFVKYAINGLLNLKNTQKSNVMAYVNNHLKAMGKDLGDSEVKKVTDILSKVYKDTYYKNAFVMDSGMKIDLKFDILKKEFINAAVNQEFKGELFSDRIWRNKANMIDKLQSSITEAMKGNTTIDKIGRDIRDTFNVQAYESQRLVRTENARIQTQASYDIAKSTGVEQVMWSATLDNLTNPEDAELDGKVWGIDEDHPEPPLHPNCRCCLINVPYEGWQSTQRKDNETKDIIDYKDYDTWLKDKNISDD